MKHLTFKTAASLLLLVISFALSACTSETSSANTAANANSPADPNRPARIGFLLETLKEERWVKDRDLFLQRAKELGADVDVQVADGNDTAQLQQAENLLTKGVDVLVVVPHNGVVAAGIVDAAQRQNVPVIAYDRMIMNSDVALYLSFDNVRVGELQAQYALDRKPKGNYLLICGSPTDNNAKMFRDGQMKVLQPAVDRGDIKIVGEQWATNWQASEAMRHTENALTQNDNDIVAVIASADSVSLGVVQALDAKGLAGKVLVTGQDADISASRNVVSGKQAMTIYKPIKPLAYAAAEAAVKLARKQPVDAPRTVNNGKKDVPSILLDPIVVDRDNIEATVVKDGYQKREDIFTGASAQN